MMLSPSARALVFLGAWAPSAITLAGVGFMLHYIFTTYYVGGLYNEYDWSQFPISPWYWPNRTWIQSHWFASATGMMLTGLQLFRPLRQRFPWLHRWMGRVCLLAVMYGMCAATLFCFNKSTPVGSSDATNRFSDTGLTFLLLPTVFFCIMILVRARQKDFPAHRRWGLRLGAILSAAPLFRVIEFHILPSATLLDGSTYSTLNWICWVPTMMLVELYLGWEREWEFDQLKRRARSHDAHSDDHYGAIDEGQLPLKYYDASRY